MKTEKFANLNTYLIVVVVIAVAIGLYFTLSGTPPAEKEKTPEIIQKEIVMNMLGTDCKDCFNISVAKDFINQQKTVKLKEVKEFSIEDSEEFVKKYNLSKLPAIVITGEVSNLTIPNFNKVEDALIFDKTPAPYYDVATKSIRGKVEVIMLKDETCTECFDMSQIVQQMEAAGVKIAETKTLSPTGAEGKELINKYKIEKLPGLLLSKDALDYDIITQVWAQVGSEESDGMLVLRLVNPPYINISTGKTEGLVTLTYIVDDKCTECFNTSIYKEILQQGFNMHFQTEETLEASSTKGKFLIKKYNITSAPTIVISKEASAYPNFAQGWDSVGTEEKDGVFIFRKVDLLKNVFAQKGQPFAYKNLETGEVLNDLKEEAEIVQPEKEE